MDQSGAPAADTISLDPQVAPRPGAVPDESGEGAGAPLLDLDGFHGPLDQLLTLARAEKIDLAALSLTVLVEHLAAALRQATVPLGQKGDWVVMAAAAAQQEAQVEAEDLRGRLVALQAAQALAAWLERRPQLGRDGFPRGRPELFGVSLEATPVLDGVEFLWASLGLFDDGGSGHRRDVPAAASRSAYRRRGAGSHPAAIGHGIGRSDARSIVAGAAGQIRRRRAAGAALALGLGQHLQRQPGTRQTGRGRGGAGASVYTIPIARLQAVDA